MELTDYIFGPNATYAANIAPTTVQINKSKYVDYFVITVNGLQNGTAAPTIANLLGALNPLNIKVGGTPEIFTRLVDLYALNLLWLNHNPMTAISAGDNETAYVASIIVPSAFPPSEQEVTVETTFNAVTAADTIQLSIAYHALDGVPRRASYHYTEFQKNTSGTGSSSGDNWSQEFTALGNVLGILFNVATIPGGGTAIGAGSINELFILVNGVQKMHLDWIDLVRMNLSRGQMFVQLDASPGDLSIIDNYRWLPFLKEPIPQGAKVQIKVNAGADASAIRTLVVQEIPFASGG